MKGVYKDDFGYLESHTHTSKNREKKMGEIVEEARERLHKFLLTSRESTQLTITMREIIASNKEITRLLEELEEAEREALIGEIVKTIFGNVIRTQAAILIQQRWREVLYSPNSRSRVLQVAKRRFERMRSCMELSA